MCFGVDVWPVAVRSVRWDGFGGDVEGWKDDTYYV